MSNRFRIPLLKDHHTHPSINAAFSGAIKLRNVTDKNQALQLIQNTEQDLTIATGWDSSYYQFSDKELDSLPPVVICNTSLHGFLINSSAKEILQPRYPEIIANLHDAQWLETNIYTILKFLTNLRPYNTELIKKFYDDELLPIGVWYAEDMLLPNRDLIDQFSVLGYSDRTRFWADEDVLKTLTDQELEKIAGIKLFTDGAIGARTAAISEPFLSGEHGILISSDEELMQRMARLQSYKLPFAIHAIGDLATAQVVNTVKQLREHYPDFPPVRIEHCQFISKDIAILAKSLGITLSMQPNFSSDSGNYSDRLPLEFLKTNNPFRMLIDDVGFIPGSDLIFGSDGMPHGAEFALKQSLFPIYESQRLTMDEFINGYCMPDMTHGSILVEVNNAQQTLNVSVTAT